VRPGPLMSIERAARCDSGPDWTSPAHRARSDSHAGRDHARHWPRLLRPHRRLRLRLRPPLRRSPMLVEYVLGGAVTAALLIYLVYALLRPEKFCARHRIGMP